MSGELLHPDWIRWLTALKDRVETLPSISAEQVVTGTLDPSTIPPIPWSGVLKAGSSLGDLATRSASDLSSGTLAPARMPALSGDVSSVVGTVATTLATVNASPGTFGSGTTIPLVTVNSKGLVTTVTEQPIQTGGLTRVNDTNVTVTLGGTPLTALLKDVSLTLGWMGTLAAARLNANVVQSITNDTNVTGSIAAQNLTLGWTGLLSVTRGGTGTGTAFTAGSVVFAGASGVYSQDNTNFFWDATNKILGVGTSAPAAGLHIKGTSSTAASLEIERTGNRAWLWQVGGSGALTLNDLTGGNEPFRVTTGGFFGLKSTSPSALLTVADQFYVDGSGRISIGVVPDTAYQMLISGTFDSATSANAQDAIKIQTRIKPIVGGGAAAISLTPTFDIAASGINTLFSTIQLSAATITASSGSGTLLRNALVSLNGTPTGGANNYLLRADGDGSIEWAGVSSMSIGGLVDTSIQLYLRGTYPGSNIGTQLSTRLQPTAGSGAAGFYVGPTIDKAGSGSHSNFNSLEVAAPIITAGAAGLTNATTLKVLAAPSVGNTKRALWVVAGNSQFDGSVGIQVTGPTSLLHLAAGTAAASTAPLKLTSGVSLTTAEAGAIEFTTDDYFATITTGAARKAFVLDDGARLTSGKIPIASTNGRLIDGPTLGAAGLKIPAIQASGASDAQVASVASVATFTLGAATGLVTIAANVNVTTSVLHSFSVQVDYTDEQNIAQTATLTFTQLNAASVSVITNGTGTGPYEGVVLTLRCKNGTSVTAKTTGTFTSVTYNVAVAMTQLT